MPDTEITLDAVSFSFDSRPVLENISLSVKRGEFVGIIGPNGAGKTTLLKLIAGLYEQSAGSVALRSRDIKKYSRKAVARLLGYVPQQVDLLFDFSVREVVSMGRYPHLQGLLNEDPGDLQITDQALEWMDLSGLKNRPFNELSGGEKQRTVIASALAQQAEVLLLDEPTSALDLKHQQSIYRTLKQLVAGEQKTIILVTHEVNLAAQFCDRLLLMDKGKIIADGPPEDVLNFSLIQQVYGVKVYIDVNPFTKSLYILPYDTK